MKKLFRSVGVVSAAVAFGAGSALVAPVAGAQSSLPDGSLGGSLGGDACGEQVVTPENLEASGWTTPEDETAAEIAAVADAPENVGAAALTFPDDTEENPGTSLYKNAERMPLADLLGEDESLLMNFDYVSDDQAPALQIRLNDASLADSEDGAGSDIGFATIVWSPDAGTGAWGSADAAESDEFWVTRALEGADGDVPRGERMSLEEIIDLNPEAVVTDYGVQKTTDNTATGVAIDNFTFGCETTNFELESDDTGPMGSLSDVFGSVTDSLPS